MEKTNKKGNKERERAGIKDFACGKGNRKGEVK